MLAATKVKMSGSQKKKKMEQDYIKEVSRCIRAKQRQRNVQKSVLHLQSCYFVN